ncbi:hypothetical protein C5E11_03930 [Clavibacter michiganensis]|nr:hypothetical protein C5E11_03930 [Clavibacter michiganensis]
MLRSTGLAHVPEEAPLVELLRTLADEMDSGHATTRARAEYLSALKDVRRVLNSSYARPTGSADIAAAAAAAAAVPAAAPSVEPVPDAPNDLASFKQRRGIN